MALHRHSSTRDSNPDMMWVGMSILLALLVLLVGAPTFIVGFFAERYTSRYRWSFVFWFLLLFPSTLALYLLYQHGLVPLITRELVDYVQSFKQYQIDFARWNFPRLWSETWPVWIRALAAIPFIGFWQEISLGARGGQTVQQQQGNEQGRQQRVQRAQKQAQKRTQRAGLPDAAAGLMVIGVPIDDAEQE